MDVFFRREKEQKLKFANSSIFGHFFLDDDGFIRPKSMNLQILIFTQQQTKKSLTDWVRVWEHKPIHRAIVTSQIVSLSNTHTYKRYITHTHTHTVRFWRRCLLLIFKVTRVREVWARLRLRFLRLQSRRKFRAEKLAPSTAKAQNSRRRRRSRNKEDEEAWLLGIATITRANEGRV